MFPENIHSHNDVCLNLGPKKETYSETYKEKLNACLWKTHFIILKTIFCGNLTWGNLKGLDMWNSLIWRYFFFHRNLLPTMAMLTRLILLKPPLSPIWSSKTMLISPFTKSSSLVFQSKAFFHQNIPDELKSKDDWLIMYKLPSIRYLRFISRFKIYQIMFMTALCCPLYFQYTDGLISKQLFYAAVGGSLGTSLVFLVFSYFTTRVIGELAVNMEENMIQISRLTFNGRRAKDVYNLDCVVPYSDNHNVSSFDKGGPFQKLYIENEDGSEHCYLFSTKLGLYKKDLFDKFIL